MYIKFIYIWTFSLCVSCSFNLKFLSFCLSLLYSGKFLLTYLTIQEYSL